MQGDDNATKGRYITAGDARIITGKDALTAGEQVLVEQVEQLRADLETERQRLAACGVAALGYPTKDCLPEYESASLADTRKLYAEKERLREENAALRARQPINVTVDQGLVGAIARAWLTELIQRLEALPKQWREQVASVNDPKSPSLLVECAEQLEQALDLELPAT